MFTVRSTAHEYYGAVLLTMIRKFTVSSGVVNRFQNSCCGSVLKRPHDALRCVRCGQPWSGKSRLFRGAANRLLAMSRCDAFFKTVLHGGETLQEMTTATVSRGSLDYVVAAAKVLFVGKVLREVLSVTTWSLFSF